jgi:hypothetical protein
VKARVEFNDSRVGSLRKRENECFLPKKKIIYKFLLLLYVHRKYKSMREEEEEMKK